MKSRRESLPRSRFTRRTATVTISAPEAAIACRVCSPFLYLPVPTMRRELKARPAITNSSIIQFQTLKSTPLLQGCEVWTYDYAHELSRIADDNRMCHQPRHLQLILNRLRSHEFSAAGLDEIFLPIGDAEESLGVDVANVASLEPVTFECFS